MQNFFDLIEANQFNVIVIIISLFLIVGIYFLTSRFESISKRYKAPYSHAILSLKKPMRWLEYALILIVVLEFLLILTPKLISVEMVLHVTYFSILISVFLYFSDLIKRVSAWMQKKAKAENSKERLTYINGVSQLSKIILYILVILSIMDHFHMSYTGVIALGGAGSLAAALAAKDLVGNLFGGLIIFLDKPFHVGDFISSPDKKIEGIVQHIGWRVTELLSLDQVPMFVPNALFTTIIIQNLSNRKKRRMREIIGIRYKDLEKIPQIMAEIRDQLDSFEFISQEDAKYVHLASFNQSTVDVLVQCMMVDPGYADFLKSKQQVLQMISEKLNQHDAAMAFPSISIYQDSGDKEESYGKQQ